jgi:hypothetical protein
VVLLDPAWKTVVEAGGPCAVMCEACFVDGLFRIDMRYTDRPVAEPERENLGQITVIRHSYRTRGKKHHLTIMLPNIDKVLCGAAVGDDESLERVVGCRLGT